MMFAFLFELFASIFDLLWPVLDVFVVLHDTEERPAGRRSLVGCLVIFLFAIVAAVVTFWLARK